MFNDHDNSLSPEIFPFSCRHWLKLNMESSEVEATSVGNDKKSKNF